MEEEYKGWRITYRERDKTFVATKETNEGEITLEDIELNILRKKCDKWVKKASNFEKVNCFYHDYDFTSAVITSVAGRGWNDIIQVWSVVGYGENYDRKGKRDLDYFYKDTPENRAKIQQIKNLNGQVKTLKKSLEKFDSKEFEKYVV